MTSLAAGDRSGTLDEPRDQVQILAEAPGERKAQVRDSSSCTADIEAFGDGNSGRGCGVHADTERRHVHSVQPLAWPAVTIRLNDKTM